MIDKKKSSTKEIFSENGVYIQPRRELHLKIIESVFEKESREQIIPESILLGGGSGSGKSSISLMLIEAHSKSNDEPITYIDADEIKKQLPEYVQMINSSDEEEKKAAAGYVHDESSDIAEEILYMCVEQRKSFIYDGTMKNVQKYKKIIADLKKASFKISAVIVDVPIEVALARLHDRYVLEGRYVPTEAVTESHDNVASTFSQIKDELDSYVLYDNTEKEPIIFAQKMEGSGEVVYYPDKWKVFYEKSKVSGDAVKEIFDII